MVLPVAFVALWSLLFNLWAEVETFLTVIASIVSHSDYGSFSAGRIMSIAISIGYLGLPAIALSILSGNALRALNHAGARLETAMLMAWRTRRTVMSFGRRWLANSPLARRWNQRVYRAVGLGTLRSTRPAPRVKRPPGAAGPTVTGRSRKSTRSGQTTTKKSTDPPDDFKLE
jgi:hypothetical protein